MATRTIASSRYEVNIRESIRIILGTARGERVMRHDFGSGVHDIVFQVINTVMLTRVKSEVHSSIIRDVPRVELLGFRADPPRATDGNF